MSSDLDIKLVKEIEINHLVQDAEAAVQELLSLAYLPNLKITRVEQGRRLAVPEYLIADDQLFIIGVVNGQDEVSLVFHHIDFQPSLTEDLIGQWATVSVNVTRTPLSFALAASVAVAIARNAGTNIIDDGLVWGHILEQSPEQFIRDSKVQDQFEDMYKAAREFYETLPIAKL